MDIQKTGKERIEQELIERYSVKGKGKIITLVESIFYTEVEYFTLFPILPKIKKEGGVM